MVDMAKVETKTTVSADIKRALESSDVLEIQAYSLRAIAVMMFLKSKTHPAIS